MPSMVTGLSIEKQEEVLALLDEIFLPEAQAARTLDVLRDSMLLAEDSLAAVMEMDGWTEGEQNAAWDLFQLYANPWIDYVAALEDLAAGVITTPPKAPSGERMAPKVRKASFLVPLIAGLAAGALVYLAEEYGLY